MNREDVAKRNASIVRDIRNGMRIRDVMKKYDVSRYTCYRTMQSVNRKERQANYSDWKAKRDEEIVNRYADGVPAEQLAKEYSVHRATIYHILSEHNKDYLRQRDAKKPNSTQLAREARQQTFIDAVKADPNRSVMSICEEFGYCSSHGFALIHKAGIYRGRGRKKGVSNHDEA